MKGFLFTLITALLLMMIDVALLFVMPGSWVGFCAAASFVYVLAAYMKLFMRLSIRIETKECRQ